MEKETGKQTLHRPPRIGRMVRIGSVEEIRLLLGRRWARRIGRMISVEYERKLRERERHWMPVRIRVRIETLKGTAPGVLVESAALVNSGFEAETRDASLPSMLAQRIGLWPPPAEGRKYIVRAYVGEGQVILVPEAVKMQVVTPDRTGQAVSVNVLITELDDEVVLSDTLAEALNVVLLRPGAGLWCFHDEPISPGRDSEPAQRW